MRLHFIAIGGAVMHSLAIALHREKHVVTGSDDEIFEPARSNLSEAGILPDAEGWFPENITMEIDAVVLGMHAKQDNPELQKALDLGIRIYSFPEFLYNETKDQLRVVIAGSHGKTTITSMVMHVLKYHHHAFSYAVGSGLTGFDNMVSLGRSNIIAIFEGDEYLSSCLDPRPKFHVYKPQIALISGIAWDHINVFPTHELYVRQFKLFVEELPENGCLIYCNDDVELRSIAETTNEEVLKLPYDTHRYVVEAGNTYLYHNKTKIKVNIFGKHNMQNISGAKMICNQLGLNDKQFYDAIVSFKGSAKRLELIAQSRSSIVFMDFAHSPSKVEATIKAVKEQFPDKKLVACLELHTYSSLNKNFLGNYRDTMAAADQAIVFYNPEALVHKRLEMISGEEIIGAFGDENIKFFVLKEELEDYFQSGSLKNTCILFMSSGNFAGIDLKRLAERILKENP